MSTPSVPSSPASRLELTADQRKGLLLEVSTIIDEHKSDTHEFMRQSVIQRRLYELKARPKTWPWPGAANFIMPLIRYVVDHFKGRIKRVFKQAGNEMWHGSIRTGREGETGDGRNWKQIAEDASTVANYLSLDSTHINLSSVIDDVTDFICKDGTTPIRIHYVSRTKPRWIRGEDGKLERVDEPYEDRVVWDPIEIQRNVWTVNGCNPEDMPVFGYWMEMTRGQFIAFAEEHDISADDIERVLNAPDNPNFIEEERILDEELGVRRDTATMSKLLNIYRIYELKVEYPLFPKQPPASLSVWYHHGTQTLLDVFDPQDFATSYEVARFIKRGKQYLGSGIAEALRVLNLGANAVFNQTVDAQTVANAFGFLYKSGSAAADFISNAGIFPAVKIPVDEDVNKEFKTFQLGSGGTAVSIGLMNFVLQLVEMVGKVSTDLGQVSAGKRVAASVGMQLSQEGNQMIDAVIDGLRDTFERAMLRSLFLYANHQPEVFDAVLPQDRATQLLAAIRDPSAAFPMRIQINLNIASASASKERDFQELVALANFLFNVFNAVTERGAIVTNPQAPPEFKQIVAHVYKAMHEVSQRVIIASRQFKDADLALPPEILQLFQQIGGIPPDDTASATSVFPRVAPPAAEALGPAATGSQVNPAVNPIDLLRNMGGVQ